MAHKKRGRELEPADWELDDALQQLHGILDRSSEQKLRVRPELQCGRWAGRSRAGASEAARDPIPSDQGTLLARRGSTIGGKRRPEGMGCTGGASRHRAANPRTPAYNPSPPCRPAGPG